MSQLSQVPFKPNLQLIKNFENELRKLPQIEIETKHYFCDGLYAREIFIPTGVVITGKLHKTQHLNFLSKGKIVVLTEEGMQELSAPLTMISEAGIKRVGLAIEDTIWTTVHPNIDNCSDISEIEFRVIDGQDLSENALKLKEALICLG